MSAADRRGWLDRDHPDPIESWTRVIVGVLPRAIVDDETIDGLVVLAQGMDIDGPGRILGHAGPTRLRPTNAGTSALLPVKAEMTFDPAGIAGSGSEPAEILGT